MAQRLTMMSACLVTGLSLVNQLAAVDLMGPDWVMTRTERANDEYSLHLELQFAVEDAEFVGDVEFDDSIGFEVGLRYQGLVAPTSAWGLGLGSALGVSMHSFDQGVSEADWMTYTWRNRIGVFYQPMDLLRIQAGVLVGLGAGELDIAQQAGSGSLGINGSTEDFVLETGVRLGATLNFGSIHAGAGIDYWYRGGDFWLSDEEIEFQIDQNYIGAYLTFGWQF